MRRVVLMLAAMALVLLLASGVAWAVNKIGTNGPDTLRGTNGDDNLLGRGGQDDLFSLRGKDNLLGGPGRDFIFGGNERFEFSGGEKNMVGGPGNDALQGGKGSDTIAGGRGNDFLLDGFELNPKQDAISAGSGNDGLWVWNRPVGEDVVSCGRGLDRVIADRDDTLAPDCERVFIGSRSEDEFFESFPESFFRGLPPPPE